MQANCPQCANRIAVDDARVPDRPFGVKCPKCGATVKFPGRGAAAAPAPAASPSPAPPLPPPAATPPPLPPVPEEPPRAAPLSQSSHVSLDAPPLAAMRREGDAGNARAMVTLPDRTLAAGVALMLSRNGFTVDTLDEWEEGSRLLEQGVYGLVATARVAAAAGKSESLYQRIGRLSPDSRRRVFLMLVGDEFKTGDALQAFVALCDVVVHSRDAANADTLLRNAIAERQRLYQAYLDARRRMEAAAG